MIAARTWLLAVLLGGALTGCASATTSGRDEPDLTFAFQSIGGEGFIDQTLDIRNPGEKSVAPKLEFVPLDSKGELIDSVKVETAFGSDRGLLVIPSQSESFDVLKFVGPGARDVEDVKVLVADDRSKTAPVTQEEWPEVKRFNAAGKYDDVDMCFVEYSITNPASTAQTYRIVGIAYEAPPPGEAQQFVEAVELNVVTLNGGETARFELPEQQRCKFGSVKAHPTP